MWSWIRRELRVYRDGHVGVFSRGLFRHPHLRALLGARRLAYRPGAVSAPLLDSIVCWGHRPSAPEAERYASRYGVSLRRLEDGFVRSVGLGIDGVPGCSLVDDPRGIYYDATSESQLEAWLNHSGYQPSVSTLERAQHCMAMLRSERISKYNHVEAEPAGGPFERGQKLVLVVDQTHGDQSLQLGLAPVDAFAQMVRAALDEHPGATVLVKVHPDALTGKKRGCVSLAQQDARVVLLGEPLNPVALLERVDHVYVATSQLGFEALMLGKRVSCFGVPFYAGWGLTDDRVPVPRRTARRSVAEVFSAAYFDYSRYVDPRTGQRCELEHLINAIVEERGRDARTGVSRQEK